MVVNSAAVRMSVPIVPAQTVKQVRTILSSPHSFLCLNLIQLMCL